MFLPICIKNVGLRSVITGVYTALLTNDLTNQSIYSLQFLSNISTSQSSSKAVHTTKGWKKAVLTGQAPRSKADEAPLACEEGKDSIPHSVLISELQKCDSVSSQIQTFCSVVSITPEEIERRKAFRMSLDEAFKLYFPTFKTYLFGSSMNGLGFKGCDADVCIKTNFVDQEIVMLKELPTLDSALQGTTSQEVLTRMHPLFMLRFVRRIIRRHCPDVKEPILFIKARCPILRFYNSKYDVFCDFSCESQLSLRNTRLLRFLCCLDERFAPVAKMIKYWGKYGGFVGDIDMFNSYSFSLLVAHFFQSVDPPIFPSIEEILIKSEYLRNASIDDDELLWQDIKKIQPSKNIKSTEELLRDFYFHFLCYDFSLIMQPFASSSQQKLKFALSSSPGDTFEFGAVNVQDPFRPNFNATGGASFKSSKRFLYGLVDACRVYQDIPMWIPSEPMWGLCSLFQPPLSEKNITKQWQQDLCHQIVIPSTPDATDKLKRILEHGLMFHCHEFRVVNDSSNSDSKVLMRLQCRAFHNTWQGRDMLQGDFQSNDFLETEHLKSKELIVSKNEIKRTLLCEFNCECSDVGLANKLQLDFTFKESKFPPIVAIFLKEFIPSVIKRF